MGAGQTTPDPSIHLWVTNPCLSWAGLSSKLPPSLCRGGPWSMQGARETPEETPGGREQLYPSLGMTQLLGSPASVPGAFAETLSHTGPLGCSPRPGCRAAAVDTRGTANPVAPWADKDSGAKCLAPSSLHERHCSPGPSTESFPLP
jgi:hypothetical protein